MAGSPRVEIVQARLEHAHDLAPRMRAADVAEVQASGGYSPLEALVDSLRYSAPFAWAALFDGKVACIWGVEPLRRSIIAGRVGAVWMLTSDLVEKHPRAFWRGCRSAVPLLFEATDPPLDVLVNLIDARHEQALHWARRLGFQLEEPAAFGHEGRPFVRFTVRKEGLRV
jgi:hypothetical protein